MTLGFMIRGEVNEERLLKAVARALGVPLNEVARFSIDSESDATILVEIIHRTAGFLTDVSLYFDPQRIPSIATWSSIDVAPPIAHDLEDEVLVSPPADDAYANAAYTWYLITPDGKRFIADELEPDQRGEVIEINRATLRPT